jgi:hypothetical protein
MEQYQIINGFSEIKKILANKYKIKDLSTLQLWFTIENDFLVVQDYSDHKKSHALAIFNSNEKSWKIILKEESIENRTIQEAINRNKNNKLDESCNELYGLFGYFYRSNF